MKKQRGPSKKTKKSHRVEVSIRRFALLYLSLMGAFFILIGFKPIQDIININGLYTEGVVVITSAVLKTMGIPCTSRGSIIELPSIALDIRFGCNGLEAVMIYAVAVIAFPSQLEKKVIGIISGFIIIQILNVLRIAGLAYSGVYFKSLFEYIHIYVAQGVMIAISLAIFFIYLNYAGRSKKAKS